MYSKNVCIPENANIALETAVQTSLSQMRHQWSMDPMHSNPVMCSYATKERQAALFPSQDIQGFKTVGPLEQGCLLHDAVELLLIDLPVTVSVSLINHFLQLLLCQILAKLLCYPPQVLDSNEPSVVIVKQLECLHNFFSAVTFTHLRCHHLQELLEVNGAGAVLVNVCNHLLDLLFLGLKAQCSHGNLQLLGIDGAASICIEQVKGLTNLLLLLLSKTACSALALLVTPSGHYGLAIAHCEISLLCNRNTEPNK
mmetsp:Transcript_24218/g.52919  ORF Transcript_24218/g.52919 Transcript_24218/m.52919 type:complete len:255 (-) Transcript_24218:30-794(-)